MNKSAGGAPIRRRKAMRYGQSGLVTIRRARSLPPVTGSLFDLSAGGCLVWADAICSFDPSEFLEMNLRCGVLTFRVMGSVRHISEGGRLLGIEFQRMIPRDAAELQLFIQELQAAALRAQKLPSF
jgi:c-di-GMP-binding flagellar brake protein YcgR